MTHNVTQNLTHNANSASNANSAGSKNSARSASSAKIKVSTRFGNRTIAVNILLSILSALALALTFSGVAAKLADSIQGRSTLGFFAQSPWWLWITTAILAGLLLIARGILGAVMADVEESLLRARLLSHAFNLGPAAMAKDKTGAYITMLVDGLNKIGFYRQTFLGPMIGALAIPVTLLIFEAIFLDWVTAAVLTVAIPLIPLVVGGFQQVFSKVSTDSRQRRGALTVKYLDAIQGLSTLRILGAAERMEETLAQVGEANRRGIMRILASNQLVLLVVDAVFSLFFVTASILMALWRLQDGAIDLGTALALVFLSVLLLEPLDQVGMFFYVGMGGIGASRGVKRFLSVHPAGFAKKPENNKTAVNAGAAAEATVDAADTVDSNVATDTAVAADADTANAVNTDATADTVNKSGVRARNLAFSYDASIKNRVLKGVNLEVEGQRIALLGPSGCGKSTLVNAIKGDIIAQEGFIEVAGAELKVLGHSRHFRAQSALVAQNTWLFSGTIADNLRLAKPEASEQEMYEALEQASLADEVRAMPQGLDTKVGEKGHSISGGQAQRLSLARAFLADRPVFLLDEATSQVDLISEGKILQSLERIPREKTVIMVSHRRSALSETDIIYTLENGKLVSGEVSKARETEENQSSPVQIGQPSL